jgi:peptide/nickel transport system permease protein
MIPFILRRLVFLVAVVIAITAVTFGLSHLTGVDPARLMAGSHATAAQLASLRHRFGLDRPLPVQYLYYLNNLAHGNFGVAIHTQHDVGFDLRLFLPATLELVLVAMTLAVAGGLVLGTLAAAFHDSWVDAVVRLVTLSGLAMPVFWLGLLGQWLFYDVLGWLPSGGRLDLGVVPPPAVTGLLLIDSLLAGRLDLFANALWHLLLPATVLSYGVLASLTRMMRASLLEVLRQDYVRTARAKGLGRRDVVIRHAVRNALLATITSIGLQFGALLGGTILVEIVFSWPGLGLYLDQSILSADYSPILGATAVIAVLYVLANLIVDVSYAVADPRIRYR